MMPVLKTALSNVGSIVCSVDTEERGEGRIALCQINIGTRQKEESDPIETVSGSREYNVVNGLSFGRSKSYMSLFSDVSHNR